MRIGPERAHLFVPFVLYVLFCATGCFAACAQDTPTPALPVPRQIVEAACGECQFGMTANGCDLAIRIDGSTYFVDGTKIDDHGDAHADDGLCNKIRKALVSGHMQNGRFVADEFRLINSTRKPTSNEQIYLGVCAAVSERFYRADFGGVDWAQAKTEFLPQAIAARDRTELAAVINAMLGRLHTSHTNFYTRDDVEYYHLADIFALGSLGVDILPHFPDGKVNYVGIGLFTRRINDEWFISGAIDGGPAAKAGLRRGQRIVSVDGQPFQPIGSFLDKAGVPVSIEVQTTPNPASRQSVTLTPIEIQPQAFLLDAMKQSMRIIDASGKKIAYVRIWSYAGPQFQDLLVEEIATGSFASADALIVDLRDGWGGADPENLQLFNRQIPTMTSVDRDGQRSSFNAHWRKPVALLVNEGTRSGKELIAYGFRKSQIGPVIGTCTAGAVTAGTLITISPDSLLYLAVKGIEVDGEILEGRGVEPDHFIPFDLPYAFERDPQLERALEVIFINTAQ